MFLDIDKRSNSDIAVIDDSNQTYTYGDIKNFSREFYEAIHKRTLIFIFADNSFGSLATYVACLNNGIVPLLISSEIDHAFSDKLINTYKPEYLWAPQDSRYISKGDHLISKYGYALVKIDNVSHTFHNDLSLLLSTSGSTGRPKLVRHSYENVEANAQNVANFFGLNKKQIAVAILPIHYTMGLSVITSHLKVGATILMTNRRLTDKKFWQSIKEYKATSFTGVPYSFEILDKLRFTRMDLPHLEILSQGGGKMSDRLFKKFADFSEKNNIKFFATYGQTEGTARMAYLAPEYATKKIGSIGKAIPNGKFYLINEHGNIINDTKASGELVYQGPNVTMGYANSLKDLSLGDENKGTLKTGDFAKRDKDGFYYIVGRKKRFLKLYGTRVSLDEVERLIKSNFQIDCVCKGNDDLLEVYITDKDQIHMVHELIVEKIKLFHKAFSVKFIEKIERNKSGKIMLNKI